jgi:hypothetical protein
MGGLFQIILVKLNSLGELEAFTRFGLTVFYVPQHGCHGSGTCFNAPRNEGS